MNLTKEQQLAVECEGSNIIVSAGAGSGKTAVLTQRVIRKLKNNIPVNKLLILTFTNEAANEMKTRIRAAIIKNNLEEQLILLDSAYITTFDSFALSIVKKYHYLLNIKENISIIDQNIVTIYKHKVLDKLFDSSYGETNFNTLISDFCLKDDKNMKDFIINVSSSFDLIPNKEEYIDNYFLNFYTDEYLNKILTNYYNLLKRKAHELSDLYDRFLSYITPALAEKLDTWFKPLFEATTYEDYLLFKNYPSVTFRGVSADGLNIKELVKNKIDEIKELIRFDNELEIISSIKSTENYAKIIIDLVKQLNQEVEEFKRNHAAYEFNDIAKMATKIVKDNQEVREELKEYFNEIMIDEYQDTSTIQEEFISLISNNNVYMVGDIKQSIYRFRNANPYIFQEKYDKYSQNIGGIKIDLLKNFRSRSETLYNINEIFNFIMDDDIGNADYIKTHNMIYGLTAYDEEKTNANNFLEIYEYDDEDKEFSSEEKELFIISEDIKNKIENNYQIFDKDTGKLRTLKYNDICIITDRNQYLDKYKKILEYHHIPSILYKDEILTNDTLVMIIKNLIELVLLVKEKTFNKRFNYLFTSIARSFIFNYTDDLIYQITINNTYKNDLIIKMCQDINLNEPIWSIINEIIIHFDIYQKITNLSNIEKNIVMINNLLDIANTLNNLGYNLQEFITYLDEIIKYDLSVKYSETTSSKNAVKIMNIHKSKGLEFPICYFTGMHNKFTIKEINDKKIITEKYGIILPYKKNDNLENTILKDLYKEEFLKAEISEKIRLFYVALTRCREKMIIVTKKLATEESYNSLVPSAIRMNWRSFKDILSSLSITNKYTIKKSANYTHDYDELNMSQINVEKTTKTLEKREVSVLSEPIINKHFSKSTNKVLDKDTLKLMEYGSKIHEILEYEDFYTSQNKYVTNLLNNVEKDFINVYKEYEFIDTQDETTYHGIIDLMLEYQDKIYLIDYKLKNIDDENYQKQLAGYKSYIEKITNKPVYTFLYSVIDNIFKEI